MKGRVILAVKGYIDGNTVVAIDDGLRNFSENEILIRIVDKPNFKINFEVVCVECTQKKRETNRHADMHVLGDYCYISKGLVLNFYEDSDNEEFKKVDLISNTKDKTHCRKFLEGKGCGKYTSYRVRYLEYGALQRKRLLLSKADKFESTN